MRKDTTLAWRVAAACSDEDPDLFFPVGNLFERDLQTRAAKTVCAVCVVREDCLAAALALGVRDGVWGGLAPDEREALARRAS